MKGIWQTGPCKEPGHAKILGTPAHARNPAHRAMQRTMIGHKRNWTHRIMQDKERTGPCMETWHTGPCKEPGAPSHAKSHDKP